MAFNGEFPPNGFGENDPAKHFLKYSEIAEPRQIDAGVLSATTVIQCDDRV